MLCRSNYQVSAGRKHITAIWLVVLLSSLARLQALAYDRPDEVHKPSAPSVQAESPQPLAPGSRIERSIEASGKHTYRVIVPKGSSVVVRVPEHSTDISIDLRTASGDKISQHPQQNLIEAIVRPTYIVALEETEFLINLNARSSGEYSIECSPVMTISENHIRHADAQKLNAELGSIGVNSKEGRERRLQKLRERIALYKSAGDLEMYAVSLSETASFLYGIGYYTDGLNTFKEALTLFSDLRKTPEEVEILLRLADDSAARSADYQSSMDTLARTLRLCQARDFRYGELRALRQIGATYYLLGDREMALDHYESAIAILSTYPGSARVNAQRAEILGELGSLHGQVSWPNLDTGAEPDTPDRKALEYYQQALGVFRELKKDGDRRGATGEADTLWSIGELYIPTKQRSAALNYLSEALTLHRDLKYRPGQVSALKSLGSLHILEGDIEKGMGFNSEALDLLKSNPDIRPRVRLLIGIAQDHHAIGNSQKAISLLRDALELTKSADHSALTSKLRYEMARIEKEIGNFANAREQIEAAIDSAESIRGRIRTPELRLLHFTSVRSYYDFYVDILMQARKLQPERNFEKRALEASERARARSLLDLLLISGVELTDRANAELLAKEKEIRSKLAQRAFEQDRLVSTDHSAEEASKLRQEISRLETEYRAVEADLLKSTPEYTTLTRPVGISSAEIQRLLDPGTVLLEFALGEKASYIWGVTPNAVVAVDLPGRAEIEAQVMEVYQAMTERNARPAGETLSQYKLRISAADARFTQVSNKLVKTLLEPVGQYIQGKRLVIVPDGALNYLPFAALPGPAGVAGQNTLGKTHEIVYLPSASALKRVRGRKTGNSSATKLVAVFADPVYNPSDSRAIPRGRRSRERLKAAARQQPPHASDLRRSVMDAVPGSSGDIPRLLFTSKEADAIVGFAGEGSALKKVGFDANKEAIFNSNLEQYRIVHFATHALLNSRHPALTGMALSLIKPDGSYVDGFLRLRDIYGLKLNAELAVLSACNTGLGKEVRGEGLIGLTRGFMYAGAPRVVASLWKVDDAATAHLMSLFYRFMLVDHMRPAAALRAAQNQMMTEPRWRSPYYWAPFVLQGEWK